MISVSEFAMAGILLTTFAASPTAAQEKTYSLSVEFIGKDGSKLSSNTFTCPLFDKCQNTIAAVFDGKPYKIGVRSFLTDEHHIRVMLRGNAMTGGPFDDTVADKAFEPGTEWVHQLSKLGRGVTTVKQGTARITLAQ
jgi:hypothetical protein